MRTVPGDTHTDIFAYEDDGDALSHAPAKFVDAQVRLRVLSMHKFLVSSLGPSLAKFIYNCGH